MRLSIHTDYALRMLICLGVRPREIVNVAEIADCFGISRHHLMRVAQRLRDGGYVETMRGNGGGLRLAQPPSAINIGAVVRCTENDFSLVACFAPEGTCRIMPACTLRSVLADAMDAFLAVLDRYCLEDLLGPRQVLLDLLGMAADDREPVGPAAGH
jgi:Rrf2 family nitric oxide-sensitive transcriptional repressor